MPADKSDSEHRCFLFLVNYARMRPNVAVTAIPILKHVRSRFLRREKKINKRNSC